jgi:hypothetical protein
VPTFGGYPRGITAGPDGNLWFTEEYVGKVGRITPAGAITEFPVPTATAYLEGITAGPDGNVWFTEKGKDRIGRVTPAGAITEFPIPTYSGPWGITAGPDGNLWFTEYDGNKIGRLPLSAQVADHLAFAQQPTNAIAGQVIFPAVTVRVLDAAGNVVAGDSSPVTLTLTGNPGGATLGGTLTVAAVNGVATFGDLVVSAAGAGYTLTATVSGLTPATSGTFTVAAPSVNQPPVFDPIANQTASEDAGPQNVSITGIGPGGADEAGQVVTLTATSSNPALIPNPVISGAGATRTLTYQPVAAANGVVTITLTAQDDGGTANGGSNAFSRTFTVTVNPVNHPPVFDPISDRTVNEDAGPQTVSITGVGPGGGPEEAGQTVTLTATSSNPALVPNPTITGSGATRTLTYQPAADASGVVTITVTADDGQAANHILTHTFTITVNPVNDRPVFDPIGDQAVNEGAGPQTVTITGVGPGGGAGEAGQVVTLIATSSNPALVPNPTISGTGATRTLTYQPLSDASGVATITVVARDNGGTANGGIDTFSRTFTITVPTAPRGSVQFAAATFSAAEKAGTATITVTRANGSAGVVTVQYAVSDGTAHAGTDYTATSGTLTFGRGETSQTFTVPVLANGLVIPDGLTVNLTLSQPGGGATQVRVHCSHPAHDPGAGTNGWRPRAARAGRPGRGIADGGRYPVSGAIAGGAFSSASHCRLNRLTPSAIQRRTSSSTLDSVNDSRFARSDSSTLTITRRRWAPAAVLFVRPALRSNAGPRCSRSVRLFVASTSGCSTNVNNSSSSNRSVNSSAKLRKSRSGGVAAGRRPTYGRQRAHSRFSNSVTRSRRPRAPKRPSAAARFASRYKANNSSRKR